MLKIGGQKVPTSLLLLVAADSVLIALGLLVATFSRFSFVNYRSAIYYLLSEPTALRFLLVIVICEISLYFNDLYDFRLTTSQSEILVRLFQAFGISCLALAVCYFIAPDVEFGRGIAVLAAPVIVGLTLGWRLVWLRSGQAFARMDRSARKRGSVVHGYEK